MAGTTSFNSNLVACRCGMAEPHRLRHRDRQVRHLFLEVTQKLEHKQPDI
jgi:hypothetical protein